MLHYLLQSDNNMSLKERLEQLFVSPLPHSLHCIFWLSHGRFASSGLLSCWLCCHKNDFHILVSDCSIMAGMPHEQRQLDDFLKIWTKTSFPLIYFWKTPQCHICLNEEESSSLKSMSLKKFNWILLWKTWHYIGRFHVSCESKDNCNNYIITLFSFWDGRQRLSKGKVKKCGFFTVTEILKFVWWLRKEYFLWFVSTFLSHHKPYKLETHPSSDLWNALELFLRKRWKFVM